jgi:hypothetical protein
VKKSRFTEEQILAILREGNAGVSGAELAPPAWHQPLNLAKSGGSSSARPGAYVSSRAKPAALSALSRISHSTSAMLKDVVGRQL